MAQNAGEILLYQTTDGDTRVDVRLIDETVWLSLNQMSELFQRDKSVISRHISNIFEEQELYPEAVVAKFATTAGDNKTYQVEYYNLDVIISVGYRVRSHRGTQFRQWATQRLREYIIKGFTMDDKRLAEGRTATDYFDELIDRIRNIRASEANFYQKIKEIYSTCSIDYDPKAETTQRFYQMVQNKLHWAVHGQTAAELIAARADAGKPNMGMTSWKGQRPLKTDSRVAKNYLQEDELKLLNLIVTQYLDFAELQAQRRQQMTMTDWANKLDDFLKLNDMEILNGLGKIKKEMAEELAAKEFDKYQKNQREIEDKTAAQALEEEAKAIINKTSGKNDE